VQATLVTGAPVPAPMKPKLVDAPALSDPFQLRLVALTTDPEATSVAPQAWLAVSPAGSVQVACQPRTAALPAVIVTVPR
jgi:hypothetical protein